MTKITGKIIADNINDDFRLAFNRLTRLCISTLRGLDKFEADYFFYTDLMHDAATMAAMKNGESRWLLLTWSGTLMFNTEADLNAVRNTTSYKNMGAIVYRITCTRAEHEYLPAVWVIDEVTI
jgi:hypothetical protein